MLQLKEKLVTGESEGGTPQKLSAKISKLQTQGTRQFGKKRWVEGGKKGTGAQLPKTDENAARIQRLGTKNNSPGEK